MNTLSKILKNQVPKGQKKEPRMYYTMNTKINTAVPIEGLARSNHLMIIRVPLSGDI